MKTSLTINKYYIESISKSMSTCMNNNKFSDLKNTKKNIKGDEISYKKIQEKENEKLNNSNNNIKDTEDEVRDGVIVSASLKQQIKVSHSKNDNQENTIQTSPLVYTYKGLYNSLW